MSQSGHDDTVHVDAPSDNAEFKPRRRGIFQSLLSKVQIQPTKVRTRKGYAKKGRGDEVGSTSSPQKTLAAVIAKRIAPVIPMRRIQVANSLGTLVRKRAADHGAIPAANEGTLASRVAAVPESSFKYFAINLLGDVTGGPIDSSK